MEYYLDGDIREKFINLVKRYIREIEVYQEHQDDYPEWACHLMMERYGVKLI